MSEEKNNKLEEQDLENPTSKKERTNIRRAKRSRRG